jgi:hypothetical protein
MVNRLVHKQTAGLDLTFAALADPVRRAVIARLAKGDEPVTPIANEHAPHPASRERAAGASHPFVTKGPQHAHGRLSDLRART